MNKMSFNHSCTSLNWRIATLVVACASLFVVPAIPAFSQASDGQFFNNAQGTMDDSNNSTAQTIRDMACLRYKWLEINRRYDRLEPANDPAPRTTPGRRQTTPEKREEFQTDGRSARQPDSGQSNIKQTADSNAQTKVLAYDSCFVPCGSPVGWFLQDAEAWKFPKYTAYGVPCYVQPKLEAMDKVKTSRDEAIFEKATGYNPPGTGRITTFGLPMSDTQFQIIDRENNNRMLELLSDPERFMWAASTTGQMMNGSAANSLAGVAESAFDNAAARIIQGDSTNSLINLANEASGTGPNIGAYYRQVSDAVRQVQIMYHRVYVPLAILFLLPGAVITQVKSLVAGGFALKSQEAQSPFDGLLRSFVAVFLIPATQLIVSYAIDVGNSMAYSVYDPWVNIDRVKEWTHQLSYNNNPRTNFDNAILPPEEPGAQGQSAWDRLWSGDIFGAILQFVMEQFGYGEGLGGNVPETITMEERNSWLSSMLEMAFNWMMWFMSQSLIILTGFQLVFMCYLFLLGPLAAAFYAWPDLQNEGKQRLFRGVFGNWIEAVISLALWRFYWMVILAIMTQRLIYISQSRVPTNLQWEVAVFTCLLGLMLHVPFSPFKFDPAAALEKVEKVANGGGGAGGGGGGGGGASGGGGQGGGGGGLLQSMAQQVQSSNMSPEMKQEAMQAISQTGAGLSTFRDVNTRGRGDGDFLGIQGGGSRSAAAGGDTTGGGESPPMTAANNSFTVNPNISQMVAANAILPPSEMGTGSGITTAGLGTGSGLGTGADRGPTSTPSDASATAGGRANPAVQLADYVAAAQGNVQTIAGGLRSAGMPEQQIQDFMRQNSPQTIVAALDPGGSGAFPSGGDEEEGPRRRPRPVDDGTDTA
jgi:hypothetical protein